MTFLSRPNQSGISFWGVSCACLLDAGQGPNAFSRLYHMLFVCFSKWTKIKVRSRCRICSLSPILRSWCHDLCMSSPSMDPNIASTCPDLPHSYPQYTKAEPKVGYSVRRSNLKCWCARESSPRSHSSAWYRCGDLGRPALNAFPATLNKHTQAHSSRWGTRYELVILQH